jgi:PiT family inorganic phosphate transporter
MFIADSGSAALNWNKVGDAGLALLISPFFGFVFTFLLVILFGRIIRKKKFFAAANPSKKPPFWIRSLLVASSTAVSFSHGSNDGQKGVGLIMIILMGIVPAKFALDSSKSLSGIIGNVNHVEWYVSKIDSTKLNSADAADLSVLRKEVQSLKSEIAPLATPDGKLSVDNFHIRKEILTISKLSGNLSKCLSCEDCSCYGISEDDIKLWMQNVAEIRTYTEYAPWWVILLVSVSLGLGTMIGWKRVAVTVGEKIGKTQLSYAQGASAGIVAASTIAASSGLGLPVSTTHVLSSGIAGSMVTRGGFKNLQMKTITSILIAWLVTIPVTVTISAGLFLLLRYLFV